MHDEASISSQNSDLGPSLYDALSKCVHCGICLSACPTYDLHGNEADSPRGRLAIMRQIQHENQNVTESAAKHIDLCIGCSACEAACPAGVNYSEALAETRELLRVMESKWYSTSYIFYNWLLMSRSSLKLGAEALKLSLKIPGIKAILSTGRSSRWKFIRALSYATEILNSRSEFSSTDDGFSPSQDSEDAHTVVLVGGCQVDNLADDLLARAKKVLEMCGCRVAIASLPSCCGGFHYQGGYVSMMEHIARQCTEYLSGFDCEAFVFLDPLCSKSAKRYSEILANDEDLAETAQDVSDRFFDFAEWLVNIGWMKAKSRSMTVPEDKIKVALQESCHLIHGQRIFSETRELLEELRSIEVTNCDPLVSCCGGACGYTVQNPEQGGELGDITCRQADALSVDAIITDSMECLSQLKVATRSSGTDMKVEHMVDVLHNEIKFIEPEGIAHAAMQEKQEATMNTMDTGIVVAACAVTVGIRIMGRLFFKRA